MKDKIKNILIVGGSSSIGQFLVRKHENLGHRVVFTERTPCEPKTTENRYPAKIQYDLVSQLGEANLCAISEKVSGFDVVYLAASAIPSACSEYELFFQTNVIGYTNLLKFVSLNKGSTVIHMSSMSCYSPVDGVLDHSSSLDLSQPYPASKNIFSIMLPELINSIGPDISSYSLIIPALLTVGNPNNFFSNWSKASLTGQNLKVFNPNSPFNACINAETIFNCSLKLIEKKQTEHGKIFLGGQITTLLDVFNFLVKKNILHSSQLEIIETDRPSTMLPTQEMEQIGVHVPDIKEILANDILDFVGSKE